MKNEILAHAAAFIAEQGIKPTAEMTINLCVRMLVENYGFSVRDAFDKVVGDGSFDKLAGMVWDKLQAA